MIGFPHNTKQSANMLFCDGHVAPIPRQWDADKTTAGYGPGTSGAIGFSFY